MGDHNSPMCRWLAFVLAMPCWACGAQATSSISGLVTDTTGAAIGGARITLVDEATGIERSSESDRTGLYALNGLEASTYTLRVNANGFSPLLQTSIAIDVSTVLRKDVVLKVRGDTQTVIVSGSALSVQADSNVLSTVVTSNQISQIATENRNYAALASLGLGASSDLPDSNVPTAVSSSFTFSVNGLRPNHNIWLIDGGESDDRGGGGAMAIMPSQEAIAEFTVLASNYPPDYGISSGATMSISLKSGTSKHHGELFEFNRNTEYDANSFFAKLSTPVTPRTPTNYNIFGGNFGGPVVPSEKPGHAPSSFFFWSEEWRKLRSSPGVNVQNTIDPADLPKPGQDLTYVPPGFDAGAFVVVPNVSTSSSYYSTRLAPLGLIPGRCFNGSTLFDGQGNVIGCQDPQVIPASLFDSNGIIYLNSPIFPRPNVEGQDKAISNLSAPIDVRDDLVRLDQKINGKWSIVEHFIHDQVSQGFPVPAAQLAWASYNTIRSTLANPCYSAAVRLSGMIRADLLVEASLNYDGNIVDISNDSNAQLPSGWSVSPVAKSFNIERNTLPGMGYMNPYGVAEDTGSAPWHNAGGDFEPRLDVSLTRGRHAMKYGFSYNRYSKNQQIFGDSQGFYYPTNTTNDSLIDTLLGLTAGYSQFQSTPIRHYVNQTTSGYGLDNWRATHRLSIQLGVRYDALPHAWEKNRKVSNFDPSLYNYSALPQWTPAATIDSSSPTVVSVNSDLFYLNGIQLAGTHGVPQGLVKSRYSTLQPRVGFSLDISRSGTTILRGGFGTFYERTEGNDIYNAATNSPYSYNLSLPNSYFSSPGINWQTGQDVKDQNLPIFPANLINLSPRNYAPPAVAMYSLGIQRQLAPSAIWIFQYVGNAAWHQWDMRQINNIPYNVGSVEIIEPNGATASVPVTCLAGDPGNHSPFGDDSLCKSGFQTFPGGQNQFLQYPGFGSIQQEEMTTNGNYNALQTGLRVQNRAGLSGEVNYTWSHQIDIESFDDNCCVSNPWNLKYDKGSGTLDRRHILSIDYLYRLPSLRQVPHSLRALIDRWSLAGTVITESGLVQPLSGAGGIADSGSTYDPVGLGGGYTVRPNFRGKARYPRRFERWFDTSQVSNVIPVWQGGPNLGFGNAGKDAIVGPGRLNFTTSLHKLVSLSESTQFELRFESFNTFNHSEPNAINVNYDPQNGPFSTTLDRGNTFGQVTSTFDPRVLELGARLTF